jgi:hypothetical protein
MSTKYQFTAGAKWRCENGMIHAVRQNKVLTAQRVMQEDYFLTNGKMNKLYKFQWNSYVVYKVPKYALYEHLFSLAD